MPAAAKNKASMRRFYREIMNKGRLDVLEALVAKGLVEHSPFPGQPPGLEGLKEGMAMFRKAFPDLHVEVEDMICEGNTVAARITYGGTHKGEFAGMKPTNKKFSVMGTDFVRLGADGKIREHWSGDEAVFKMMQQLGAIPSP